MEKNVSKEQIEKEIKTGFKPLAIESGLTILPIAELSDRNFELLVYSLIKQEIADGEQAGYTDIALMQGVSERGRDCVLYYQGKVSGLVQCKKYQGRLSKPQVIKEIIKFLLFSTLDGSILPEPKLFEYKIYTSNDLTEQAINLVYSYKNEIEKEISTGKIKEYVRGVVEEYESFSNYVISPPVSKVEQLLRMIKVSSCNATDITKRVYKHDSILNAFFNIKTVVSLEAADEMIRAALDDYGLKFLTDDDLKILQNRIGNTKEENRINLGYVDFFGFNREFFKFLRGKGFQEVMSAVTSLHSLLDRELINFVNAEIHKRILENITEQLLNKGIIHPFSVGIAAPYLFRRVSIKLIEGSMPKSMFYKFHPHTSYSKDELISEISEILFESSERVMNGDYSQLVGNPDDIEFKKRIYKHMHQGLTTIQDARTVFKKDIDVIKPVLDKIESELGDLISIERTIVIKGASFLDNKNELTRMLETIKAIE